MTFLAFCTSNSERDTRLVASIIGLLAGRFFAESARKSFGGVPGGLVKSLAAEKLEAELR